MRVPDRSVRPIHMAAASPPAASAGGRVISCGRGFEMRVANPSSWAVFSVVGDSLTTAHRFTPRSESVSRSSDSSLT